MGMRRELNPGPMLTSHWASKQSQPIHASWDCRSTI